MDRSVYKRKESSEANVGHLGLGLGSLCLGVGVGVGVGVDVGVSGKTKDEKHSVPSFFKLSWLVR